MLCVLHLHTVCHFIIFWKITSITIENIGTSQAKNDRASDEKLETGFENIETGQYKDNGDESIENG